MSQFSLQNILGKASSQCDKNCRCFGETCRIQGRTNGKYYRRVCKQTLAFCLMERLGQLWCLVVQVLDLLVNTVCRKNRKLRIHSFLFQTGGYIYTELLKVLCPDRSSIRVAIIFLGGGGIRISRFYYEPMNL
jgi:hypothetical protein